MQLEKYKFRSYLCNLGECKMHYLNLTEGGTYRLKNGTIMQWSGLRDKNGKEIYEGDVLKIDGRGLYEVLYSPPAFTAKRPGSSKLYYLNSFSTEIDMDDLIVDALEIVGNIHENPNLLTPSL